MEAAAAAGWNSHLGMEGEMFDQWEVMEQQFTAQQIAELQQSLALSSEQQPQAAAAAAAAAAAPLKPRKSLKTRNASSPSFLSFGRPDDLMSIDESFYGGLAPSVSPKKEMDLEAMFGQQASKCGASMAAKKPSHSNKEHIIAERKRREKLNQRFIALSAIVPGLKKMDKTSVLSDAIKYLKQLQEKVKSLEEQAARKTVESALVRVKKSHLCGDDDDSHSSCSCDDYDSDSDSDGRPSGAESALPEIEAKISDSTILVKIHCEKHKGVLVKALSEIENIHLSVINTSVMLFTTSSLDITVMAQQIEEEFDMTAKEVVKKLSSAFRQPH
ncbi:transcription factor NAI1-like isoform X6 [Zingiber officinale]|uniref:transcription factor NAI1-like isoform X6 n=1 Tax=Zingiber officinale TaxID=94328 RepID=UPI001C4B83C2|nr:transcription factor NAI1-like isoform X6 [Zingiber officinale]XP_042414061.1 transcription factor NAI1-like isoform X6 [Zingiber officinale]